jgi:hypothetical protein
MSLDKALACVCSPALCGIKPAAIASFGSVRFLAESKKIAGLNRIFNKDGKFLTAIVRSKNLVLVFVYDRKLLASHILSRKKLQYLASKGYPAGSGFEAIVQELLKRLEGNSEFPHEIGLFLGYPLEDVIGFERYNGTSCKFCGLWKVYGDVGYARRICSLQRECRKLCRKWIEEGNSLPQVIAKYRRAVEKSAARRTVREVL